MTLSAAFNAVKSSNLVSWKSTGRLQQTLVGCIEKSGKTLHSGKVSTVRLWPEFAGKGRYFEFRSKLIPASIDFAKESPLCTTLCKEGVGVRTVEHLLSALEAQGVDNCKIEIRNLDGDDHEVEVPIFDGSASAWVEAIEQVGIKEALDQHGNNAEKVAPYLNEPVYVQINDSFVAAFPSPKVHISYGIDFPQVPAIGCQWFSAHLEDSCYSMNIASSRTFCIYEEVEFIRNAGLIKGGSLENAIVCSASKGWLNPPLRFPDEPCRHKLLDFVGDLSLFARNGSQGLPVAHMVAFKGGHALHVNFARRLSGIT
ncbi:UDP-3-O-acyl N-acetylglucosamine deacetylase [Melia azedarach]|uniref:UDP-3-O-acyl N-acetylglucosamine deacetylase n=1 Tax=Melia azedarach TaxID=155640 RepID=A0ACC1XFD3_MELAZ|nr:UDP-3-O-acyl N-acetylglucosamine deacetylase [Melia azedarach]